MKAKPEDCVLLVVDVQERLIGTVAKPENLIANVNALVKTARLHDMPVLFTEQEKLGETVKEIEGRTEVCKKMSFSCCDDSGIMKKLESLKKKSLIICGIEAHICIQQTTLDLLEDKFKVYVVKDAISSHDKLDCDAAVERMRDAGAVITTTEAILFELTVKAGTEQFKRMLEIVKERRAALSR
ncbi:MAG: isochorismatase family protein [Candidatus Altiarchaeota archaeon]|nr:isochorismatase family protein [Candidatus Altiarchaeota archaeon]